MNTKTIKKTNHSHLNETTETHIGLTRTRPTKSKQKPLNISVFDQISTKIDQNTTADHVYSGMGNSAIICWHTRNTKTREHKQGLMIHFNKNKIEIKAYLYPKNKNPQLPQVKTLSMPLKKLFTIIKQGKLK